ncbi:hypothetical protein H0H92_008560, partial [Tricholoma furcatifolium]
MAFVQGQSYIADDPFFDPNLLHSLEHGTMTSLDSHAFHVRELREMDSVVAPSIGRISPLPPRDVIDELAEGLESLSIFGRTKAQVVLDPSLEFGTDVQFKQYMVIGDGDVVPVVTLEDMKWKDIPIPRFTPAYTPEESFGDHGVTPDHRVGEKLDTSALDGLHLSQESSVDPEGEQYRDDLLAQDNFVASIASLSAPADILPAPSNIAGSVTPLSGDATPRDLRGSTTVPSDSIQNALFLWDQDDFNDLSSSYPISSQFHFDTTQLSE